MKVDARERFTRKNLPPEYCQCMLWPAVDAALMSDPDRKRFLSFQEAISRYLEGDKLEQITCATRVNRAEVIRLLNACVSTHGDGRIYGWRALIKGTHIKVYQRLEPVVASKTGGGMAGAWTKFLSEYPAIQKELDKQILKIGKRGVIHESRVTAYSLQETLKLLLATHKVPAAAYPNNTWHKAARSLSAYAKQLRENEFAKGALLLGGKNAATQAKTGTSEPRFKLGNNPYDSCATDAHRLDFVGTVAIPTAKGPQYVAISRIQFLPIVDNDSTAILGYATVLGKECSARDLNRAIRHSLDKWEPLESPIAGLNYPQEAGMPSSRIPELEGAVMNALLADNAGINYSAALTKHVRQRMGMAIDWGPVGDWFERDVIENVFGVLESRGFQRLPNTTGSRSGDPRRTDPAAEAIKHTFDWTEMLFLIDLAVTTYNITGRKNLGYRTPLQYLEERIRHPASTFLPRKLPPLRVGQADIGIVVETRPVRGNTRSGRRPYVQIDNEKYSSPVLASAANLIGVMLSLHIDEDDMRLVKAFLPSGAQIGYLTCLGPWGRVKHSRSMRREVNRLIVNKTISLLPGEEPFQAYLRTKAEKALTKQRGKKPSAISRDATQLVKAAHEFDLPIPSASPPTINRGSSSDMRTQSAPSSWVPRAPRRGINGGQPS